MTYSSRLRAKLDPQHPCNKTFNQRRLSPDAIDAIAERVYQEKMYGGFKKSNKCPDCNILRTVTGICGCSVL